MIDESAFVHNSALIDDGASIGAGTRVWAFSHVLSGAKIGSDCNICDHTFVENEVVICDRVTIKSGVYLWDGVKVESDVFIGPCVTFTNDRSPRSRKYPEKYLKTVLQQGCSVGANSTILPGIVIGEWSLVGAGSVVTKNVKNYSLVCGNPAKLHGFVCRCGEKLHFIGEVARCCGFEYVQRNDELEVNDGNRRL